MGSGGFGGKHVIKVFFLGGGRVCKGKTQRGDTQSALETEARKQAGPPSKKQVLRLRLPPQPPGAFQRAPRKFLKHAALGYVARGLASFPFSCQIKT